MSEAGKRRESPACAYCGEPLVEGRTCRAHRDLEQLDPHEKPAREPASEAELGVRKPRRISRRAGRRELY